MTIGRNLRAIALGAVVTVGMSGMAIAQSPAAPQPPRAERASPDSGARVGQMRHRIARDRAMRVSPRSGRALAQRYQMRRSQMQRARMMERARMGAGMRGMRPMPPHARSRRMAMGDAALMRGIDLTDAQRSSMRALRERYRTQSAELMRAARPDSAMRMEMRKRQQDAMQRATQLREQESAEIRKLLTPEQQKQFDDNREQATRRMEQMRERASRQGRGRIAPAPSARQGATPPAGGNGR